jgi:TetR/AcrR family transcriptional regulator
MQVNPISTPDPRQSAGEKAILDAAIELFSEYGYDGVSMRQIAEAAGVSKANIYHHFNSKEALYLAILHGSARHLSEIVEVLAEGEGDFQQRLRVFASTHLEHLFANEMRLRLVLREAFSGDEDKSRMVAEQVVGGTFNRVVAIFQAGQKAGVLRSDLDAGLCATLLMGANVFYFQAQGVLRQCPEAGFATDSKGFNRQMADVMLRGMLCAEYERGAAS